MLRGGGMEGIVIMSVPATLIRTTLSTIQKELRQLEHWLITLSGEPVHSIPSQEGPSIAALSAKMDHIIKHYESQQLALNHIVDRLDILEGTRENDTDLWLDSNGTCLENIVVEPLEPMYIVRKSESESPKAEDAQAGLPVVQAGLPVVQAGLPSVQAGLPSVQAGLPSVQAGLPSVQAVVHAVQHEVPTEVKEAPPAVPIATSVHAELPVVQAELPVVQAELPVVQAELPSVQDDIPPVNAAPSIISVPSVEEVKNDSEEDAEEDEEEGGVELEEVTYKGKSYYKDPAEGFIYGIDEEGQPTDQPIGVWKEKSQSISFYRTQPK